MLVGLAVLVIGYAQAAPVQLFDPSFGRGGKITTEIGSSSGAADIALQPDGKIIAAGSSDDRIALARYKPDGSLDPGFGGGWVTTEIGSRSAAQAVALQPDGKIIAAGSSDGTFALARYTPDSALDSSFGSGGTVTTPFERGSAYAYALALAPDGRIVAAGVAGSEFALARYNADGSLDTSFGDGGKVTTGFDPADVTDDRVAEIVLQPDGKIVAAGTIVQRLQLRLRACPLRPGRFARFGLRRRRDGHDGARAQSRLRLGARAAAGRQDRRRRA